MTTSLSLGNLFPGPVINSSILSFSGIGITSYPGAKPTGKCADCFDPGKNTFPIIHMFLLEGLPTCLGHAGLWAVTAGSACNSTSGSTTGIKQWFSARRDTNLPGNQGQCQDISHCHNRADAPGIWWVEAQDAIKHPPMHRHEVLLCTKCQQLRNPGLGSAKHTCRGTPFQVPTIQHLPQIYGTKKHSAFRYHLPK